MKLLNKKSFSQEKRWTIATLVFIAGVGLLPVLFWFIPEHVIVGADFTVALDPVIYFKRLFFAWLSNINGGGEFAGHGPATAFYQGILTLPYILTGSLISAQKIMFAFWLIMPNLSMLLMAKFFQERYKWHASFIFFAVLIYTFNLYRTIQFHDAAHLATYTILPVAFLLFFQTIVDRKNTMRNAVLIGLLGIVGSIAMINPPMLFAMLLIFAIFTFGYWSLKLFNPKTIKKNIRFILLTLLIFILINAYWLMPFASSYLGDAVANTDLQDQEMVDWLGGVSKNTSLLNNTRMLGAWDWYSGHEGDDYIPYASTYLMNPLFVGLSFLLPLLGFLALFIKRQKFLTFAVITAIAGILLASGSHEPFGYVFEFMARNVPLFWMFRSPWYKFSLLIAFGLAIAAGYTLSWLFTKARRINQKKWLGKTAPIVFTIAVFVILAIFNYPLVTGDKFVRPEDFEFLTPFHAEIPDYVHEASDFINKKNIDERVLMLPAMKAFSYDWDFSGITDATFYLLNTGNVYKSDLVGVVEDKDKLGSFYNPVLAEVVDNEDQISASRLLQLMNTRYILQKNDMRYDFYNGPYSPQLMKEKLTTIPNLELEKTFGEWDIYKLKSNFDKVFAPDQIILFTGNTQGLARFLRKQEITPKTVLLQNKDNAPEQVKHEASILAKAVDITCDFHPCDLAAWQQHDETSVLKEESGKITTEIETTKNTKSLYISFSPVNESVELEVSIDDSPVTKQNLDLSVYERKDIELNLTKIKPGTHQLVISVSRPTMDNKKTINFTGIHLIESQEIKNISQDQEKSEVYYEKISPSKYKINIKNTQKPFILPFLENFDEKWKAYIIDDQEENPYTWGKQPIEEKKHHLVNGYGNGWLIEETGDFQIIIEYSPQRIIIVGSIISGIAILGAIITLIALKYKNKKAA